MELDIEKFSPAKAELQSLVEKARLVTKDSPEDEIHEMKKRLQSTRTGITKTGKAMREDVVRFQKEVIKKENELIAIIKPEEDRIDAIEEERATAKLREERRAVLPARKSRIEAIEDTEPLPSDDALLDMDGAQFEGYLNQRVAEKNRKDQQKIDDEKRKLDEEKAKLDREKEIAEAKKRAAAEERERIELEAKRNEDRERREKQDAEEKNRREQELLEREGRYQSFLKQHGYDGDTKHEFHIERSDAEIKLYKLVGTLKIN